MIRKAVFLFSCVAFACFTASSSYGALVARWSGDNTAIDATGNGHDGVVSGVTYTPGVFGSAYTFGGDGDSIVVPASPALEPPEFSVSLWVKAELENHIRMLVDSTHGPGQAGWALQINQANNISFAHGNGSTFPEIVLAAGLNDGNFHHVAATFDGSTMKLYVDGGTPATLAYSGTPAPSGRDIQIGHSPSLNRPLEGALDEIRIYDHALSPAEIDRLVSVPEPATLGLLAVALGAMVANRKRG